MIIRTQAQVWYFAVAATFIATSSAIALNIIVYPRELWAVNLPGTVIVVPLIAMPICLWVGAKVRENTPLSGQPEHLLTRDRMTDVCTRDYFFSQVGDRPDVAGVILMIDVDRFKTINETHGHWVGDEAIKAVALVLVRETRVDDLVCRYGGGAFAAFLPKTTISDAFEMAERVREEIEQILIMDGSRRVRTSVSIGGAIKHKAEGVAQALQKADRALLRAQEEGRNRTIFASTPRITPPA